MTRQNVEGSRLDAVKIWSGFKMGRNSQTLAGTKTLTTADPPFQAFDPDGSDRTILLPAEASSDGLIFIVTNWGSAGEQLAVKEDAGSTTILTVEAGDVGVVICDGTTWRGGVLMSGAAGVGAAAAIADLTGGTNINAVTANNVLIDSSATNPSDTQYNDLAKELLVKVNAILAALRAKNIILT